MDPDCFDDLTRSLARGLNRRAVLRGLGGGLAAALGLARSPSAAQQTKQPLCHATGDPNNPWVVIDVPDPAWPAHLDHGDTPYVNCCAAGDCPAPADPCQVAVCKGGACGAAPGNAGTPCDDGNACTEHDACDAAGACNGTPIDDCCNADTECVAPDDCTTARCVEHACIFAPVDCDDDNACTIDSCDQSTGLCVNLPIICNDNNACTTDTCVDGKCVFTPVNCDDGNACTRDTCVDGTCRHTPDDSLCGSSDPCLVPRCDLSLGCVLDPLCDDGNPCTDDTCVAGECRHTPANVCNDGLRCTDDICRPDPLDPSRFTCEYIFDPSNCGPTSSCQEALCGIDQDCVFVSHDDLCPIHPKAPACLLPKCNGAAGCVYQDICGINSPECRGCTECSCNVERNRCVPSCPV